LTFDTEAADQVAPDETATSVDTVTIIVCSSCRGEDGSDARPRPGENLAEAARALTADPSIRVETAECLGNCKRRLSAALVKDKGWSYVFGDLTLENAADLIEGARLFQTADNGLIPWRGRPDCLKRGLVSRIPPLSMLKEQK
jgi:predicted metal-binding protein